MASNLTQSGWSGNAQLGLGLGWGLFTGCAGDNHAHAHHAVQIVLSETPQRIWTASQSWRSFHGAVIGPDVQHCFEESDRPVTLLYLEPDHGKPVVTVTRIGPLCPQIWCLVSDAATQHSSLMCDFVQHSAITLRAYRMQCPFHTTNNP